MIFSPNILILILYVPYHFPGYSMLFNDSTMSIFFNYEQVQDFTEYHTYESSNKRQQDIFPEYIFRYFNIIEAKHFQSCKLSLTLCNVNTVQIIKYYECKHSRRNDQDYDHQIQAGKHIIQLILNIMQIRDCQYLIFRKDFFSGFFHLFF